MVVLRDLAARHAGLLLLSGGLAAAACCAEAFPPAFWALLASASAAAAALLIWRYLPAASAAWLVIAACTPEMTLHDLIGPEAFQPAIAAVKGAGLLLALACALRYGRVLDGCNPAWAFAAMFAAGLAHGLHPGLTLADSLRSLVGSAAPYLFCFARPDRRWCNAMIRAAQLAPLASVAAGAALNLAGVRPLFVEGGGWRLAATGHPAFLAGAALAACYACLIAFYRDGRGRDLALLGANLLILLLTGARAPLFYAALVIGLTLGFVPSARVARRTRLLLLLGAAAAIPVLLAGMNAMSGLRVFNLLLTDASDLSGRAGLWRYFEDAAARSPWFGWGVGAGNVIVPQESPLVALMHTWAAHNEWLRMEAEGGWLGLGLLAAMFALWAWRHTRPLDSPERIIMRLAFVAFACHAWTDNVLISTSASVLFALCAAVFARGAAESKERRAR